MFKYSLTSHKFIETRADKLRPGDFVATFDLKHRGGKIKKIGATNEDEIIVEYENFATPAIYEKNKVVQVLKPIAFLEE